MSDQFSSSVCKINSQGYAIIYEFYNELMNMIISYPKYNVLRPNVTKATDSTNVLLLTPILNIPI